MMVVRDPPLDESREPKRRLPPSVPWLAAIMACSIGILIVLLMILFVLNLLRRGEKPSLAACDQPAMAVLFKGGVPVSDADATATVPVATVMTESTVPTDPIEFTPLPGTVEAPVPTATLPPSRPIVSLAFLELPFPYNGGNEHFGGTLEQFRDASQRRGMGGRINSFFDHFFPLYPASNDPNIPGGVEPAEAPIGNNVLLFTGELSPQDSYSGHPALDYSTFERLQPTTPVFAAADGTISFAGEHTTSGALFVRMHHSVPDVGVFQTTYWHLHPDEYFEAMLGREGEFITAGTRVGTMGNTGWSTGHHLHFEVRFDRNGDGFFSGGEAVDPYGFIPTSEYPVDPWFDRAGLRSDYLWIHPLGVTARVGEDGSGQVDTGGTGGAGPDEEPAHTSICAPPGSLPPGGTVQISWAPDPAPAADRTGAGHSCVFTAFDAGGSPVSAFDPPVEVAIPFSPGDLGGIDPETLAIYWKAPGETAWRALPTTVDLAAGIAVAQTDRPGQCALMGSPIVDRIQPVTTIEAEGERSPSGAFYDRVTISLHSTDAMGIAKIEYSLDAGSTWREYSGPFELFPGSLPMPFVPMDAQFFGGLPGTHLVLAAATDRAGNVEDPPAFLRVSIDPSQNPFAFTATPTGTPTPTPTLTMTPSPTATESVCAPTLTILQGAFCRSGPGTVYDVVTGFEAGALLQIMGQNMDPEIKWWRVSIPNTGASCWVSDSLVETSEGAACAAELPDPPTPTPSPTSTPTPTPTPTPSTTPPSIISPRS